MDRYPLALYAHLLILATLLGADLGRAWLARAGAAPAADPQVRAFAVRGVLALATASDIALILMFPAGFELASTLDAYRIDHPVWRVVPWTAPVVLLAVTVAADRAAAGGGGRLLAGIEGVLRAVWGLGQVWDGASVIFLGMTHMVEAQWLAAKLSIFGLVLLLSIPLRRTTLQLRREQARAAAGEARAVALLQRLQVPVLAGLLLILAIAWLGTAKPG